jgi:hypothetical protein
MKKTLPLFVLLLLTIVISCSKNKTTASEPIPGPDPYSENYGPYGKFSAWRSIGGDTIFSDTLRLAHFYTEKSSPCDICYYQQNYSLWDDYDYTLVVSKCFKPGDTLIIKDPNTIKKAIFKHLN